MYKADLFILWQWIQHFTIASIKSSCFSQQQNVHLVILFSLWPKWIGCCFIFWLQILDWTTNRQSLQCKLLHFLQQILVFVHFFTKVVQIWLLHFYSLILPLLSRSYRKQADEDRSVSITLCLGSQFQHPVMEPLQDVRRALVETNKCSEYLPIWTKILNQNNFWFWPLIFWQFSFHGFATGWSCIISCGSWGWAFIQRQQQRCIRWSFEGFVLLPDFSQSRRNPTNNTDALYLCLDCRPTLWWGWWWWWWGISVASLPRLSVPTWLLLLTVCVWGNL